jgi:hypothetical protein
MALSATTQGELEKQVVHWRCAIYLDFDGDPVRATDAVYGETFSSTGDSELDGTYEAIPADILGISPVSHSETGSEAVEVSLSGLVGPNSDLLNVLGDETLWQGRIARLWFFLVDENESRVGDVVPYYTGYMDSVSFAGTAQSQSVTLTIENYLVSISGASGKTYLMQDQFDSNDTSARASIAAANGLVEGVLSGGAGGGGGGGGGGRNRNSPRTPEVER